MKYLFALLLTSLAFLTSGCEKLSAVKTYNETSLLTGQVTGTLPDGREIKAYKVLYFTPDAPNSTSGSSQYHYIYVVDNAKSTTSNYMNGKSPVTTATIEQ